MAMPFTTETLLIIEDDEAIVRLLKSYSNAKAMMYWSVTTVSKV
jgi:hypothetical protein